MSHSFLHNSCLVNMWNAYENNDGYYSYNNNKDDDNNYYEYDNSNSNQKAWVGWGVGGGVEF